MPWNERKIEDIWYEINRPTFYDLEAYDEKPFMMENYMLLHKTGDIKTTMFTKDVVISKDTHAVKHENIMQYISAM